MNTTKTRKPVDSNPLEPKIVVPRRRRKVKVRPYHDPARPKLKFVVNHREAGRRRRSYFPTKEEAQSFATFKNAELKTEGYRARRVSHGVAHHGARSDGGSCSRSAKQSGCRKALRRASESQRAVVHGRGACETTSQSQDRRWGRGTAH